VDAGPGRIRHGVFRSLRSDKPAKAIIREQPQHIEALKVTVAATPAVAPGLLESLRVTHPERIIDASSGTTKFGSAALLRTDRQADDEASEGPPGVAGARARWR